MPAKATTEYHYIGHYAHTLANGRPIEPSEVVKLDKDEVDDNKVMIDEGTLVKVEGGEK